MPFCLEHRYFGAINIGSDYVGILFIKQDAEASFCIWMLSLNHITHQRPVIHLKFLTVLPLERFEKKLIMMVFRTLKELFITTRVIYEKWISQTYIAGYRGFNLKTGNYYSWVFFVGQCNRLSFKPHVNKLCRKVSSAIRVIK